MVSEILAIGPLLLSIIALALIFDFVTGWNDSANAIATVIATRVLTPFQAVALASACNLLGALLGMEIAHTIVAGMIETNPAIFSEHSVHLAIASALLAAIIWCGAMTLIGMPISGTHALLGGLGGAALSLAGWAAIIPSGFGKLILGLIISPLLGALIAWIWLLINSWICFPFHARLVDQIFRLLQICSSGAVAFAHGLNDAQKAMGIITLALFTGGVQSSSEPQDWVRLSCAVMISLGTAVGGWRVIRTLGMNLSRLTPFSGFHAEGATTLVLLGAAAWGVPISSTHTITGSIVGVGMRDGLKGVQWIVGQKILFAWVVTLPICALVGASVAQIMRLLVT